MILNLIHFVVIKHLEGDMTESRLLPRAYTSAIDEFEAFKVVALFCAIGLLVSVCTLVIDAHLPGIEWF